MPDSGNLSKKKFGCRNQKITMLEMQNSVARVNSVTRSQRSASRAYQPTIKSNSILWAKLE